MMDITNLPDDLVVYLARYLDISDLLACCAVNRSWRTIFNSDVVWKKRCDPKYIKILEVNKCEVEPKFELLECYAELPAMCESRNCFAREIHLLRNWVNKRFNTSEVFVQAVEPGPIVDFHREASITSVDVLVDDDGHHWMIIHTNRLYSQVWNLQADPYWHATIRHNSCSYYMATDVVGSNLVIIEGPVFQVFRISSANITVICRQHCEQTEADVFVPESFWKNTQDYLTNQIHQIEVVGDILIGCRKKVCRENELVHFWNINSGHKITTGHIQLKNPVNLQETYLKIQCTSPNGKFVMFYHHTKLEKEILSLFVYDLSKTKFIPMCLESICSQDKINSLHLLESVVVTVGDDGSNTKLCFYDIDTRSVIGVKQITGEYKAAEVFGDQLVLIYDKHVDIIDGRNQLVSSRKFRLKQKWHKKIHPRFLAFWGKPYIIKTLELVDIDKKLVSKVTLPFLPVGCGSFYATKLLTKNLFIYDLEKYTLRWLNFW